MRVAVFTSVTLVIVAVIAAQVFRSPRELLDEQDMTASEVLRGMIQKYQQATSYSDQGVIRVTQISAEQQVQQSAPFAVQFERSGRLRVRAYEILLASDGKRLRARYMDPSVPDLSRQTLDVAAPSEMDLAMLQFDNFLWEHLDGGMGGLPVSLRLLLDSDALADVFAEDVDLELQTPQMIGDDRCYVVGAKSAGGAVEFWVDAKDFILRRFEYPALDGFRLRADFVGANWQVTGSDGAFQLPKQEQVRRVTHFVIPPQPLPTKIFGQAVNRFEFREVGGELISATQLAGINKVLVWFNDHPSCREVLSLMQRVADSQEDHQKVRFLAVWAEGTVPGDEELHRLLESWQVDLPLVRDLGAFGRDAFGVPAAPTTVVLDTNNRVQVFEVGVRPDVEEFLPGVLHRLALGEDVAAELLQARNEEARQFQHDLIQASADAQETVIAIPASLAPQSLPERLALREVWRTSELNAPGNVVMVREGTDIRLAVNENGRAVVELDLQGNLVERFNLDLPADGRVTYLRPSYDSDGQRYVVGGSSLAPQIYGFNQRWETVLRYPDDGQPHEGIQDALLFDLTGDGTLEMFVGFWGLAGIHCVDLFNGKRKWGNRAAHSILSLNATAAGEGMLLATSAQGRILPIRRDGRNDREVAVDSRSIYHLAATETVAGKPVYCGLAFTDERTHMAIGIDEKFHAQWTHALTAGMHQTPVRPLMSGNILDGGPYWMIPGADGSVHIVSADGTFQDVFNTGVAIRGLAAFRIEEDSWLVVSTEESVTGYVMTLPATE